MIRIAITPAAFDAIAATLPLGSVRYETEPNERGERYIWLAPCGWRRSDNASRKPPPHFLFLPW